MNIGQAIEAMRGGAKVTTDDEAIFAPCTICGEMTALCCADCGIDSGGENIPHVCAASDCRDKHEAHVHGPRE